MDAPNLDPVWLAHAKIAFAALCGGILRLIFRPAATAIKTVWLLFGCVTCGYYATPAVMDWWDLSGQYAGAVGALLGFIGLSLAEGLLKAVDGFDLKGAILRWVSKSDRA